MPGLIILIGNNGCTVRLVSPKKLNDNQYLLPKENEVLMCNGVLRSWS